MERIVETASQTDLESATSMVISGLEPADRLQVAQEMILHLPSVMRAMVLGRNFTLAELQAATEHLGDKERRAGIVDSLLEHGRETHCLDLSLVPAGTNVSLGTDIFLGRIGTPSQTRPEDISEPHIVRAVALGNSLFELHTSLYALDGRLIEISGEEISRQFPANSAVTLSGIKAGADGNVATTVIRHGKPLVASTPDIPAFPLAYHDPHRGPRHCYLAYATLDDQQVFFEPTDKHPRQ
jgi:hypothetical protein